jgi:hypothetical protein
VERPLRDMRRPLFFRVLALALAACPCATRAKRDAGTLRRQDASAASITRSTARFAPPKPGLR